MELFASSDDVAELEAKLSRLRAGAQCAALITLAWYLRQRDSQRALSLAHQAAALLPTVPLSEAKRQALQARLLLVRAKISLLHADPVACSTMAQQARAIFESLADPIGVGDALWEECFALASKGKEGQLDACLADAQAAYQKAHDPARVAAAQARRMGHAVYRDPSKNTAAFLQAFPLGERKHPAGVQAWICAAHTAIANFRDDAAATIKHARDTHTAALASGQVRLMLLALIETANAFTKLGDLDGALEASERALSVARPTGWPHSLGFCLFQLGELMRKLARPEEAQAYLEEGLQVMAALSGSRDYRIGLRSLGQLKLDQGDPAAALALYERCEGSEGLARPEPDLQVQLWCGQAEALFRLGQTNAALSKAQAALDLARQQGSGLGQIETLSVLARLSSQTHGETAHTTPALDYLNQAMAVAATLSGYVVTPALLGQLAAAHAASGDFEAAYRCRLDADAALKRTQTEAMHKRALALLVRHELERAQAQAEHQRQLAQTEAKRAQALQENSDTLVVLGQIGREITSSLNTNDVFEALHRHTERLIDTSFFGICLLDEPIRQLDMVFAREHGKPVPLTSYALDQPNSSFALCARERTEQIINLESRAGRAPPVPGTLEPYSLMFFPLMVGERLLGVMSVQSPKPQAYQDREVAIFRALCGYGAIALDNAQAYRRLEAATAAKGQFLANMSHEIRTPMNAVLGMLKLLQNTELSTRQLDYTVKAAGAAKSLLGLINDILDFSKMDAAKMTLDPQPLQLDQLLRDLSVIVSTNLGKKPVELLFDIDPRIPPVLVGDALRLQQVLINLSGNAIKFTAAGEVVISIQQVDRSEQAVTLRFAVRDSGIGIAPENQGHIFDGFSQAEASTTRRFGGTGLGLSISKRLVDLMGGELALHSVVGEGSTFFFTITLPIGDHRPTQADSLGTNDGLTGDFHVLVVDDNALARELLQHMAESLGWQADAAANGSEALQLMATRKAEGLGPYQAVFMDWEMPGMDGWEALAQMRSNAAPDAPMTVMVTAHGRERLTDRSADEQASLSGILVKPVTAAMLLDIVRGARADTRKTQGSSAHGQARGQSLQGLRLLLVEDNELNQQVAQELLEDAGASVQIASDGQVAVDLLRQDAAAFDLILMDLQMPVMDGFTATRLIRSELGLTDMPIIAMTANAMASDRAACLEAGMNDHVPKPFDVDVLVRVLQRVSGRQEPSWVAPTFKTLVLPAELIEQARTLGIDAQAAIDRFLGKADLYQRMVTSFVTSATQLPDQLRTCLLPEDKSTVDAAAATMALHSLKALAATLGADDLARCGADGENRLNAGEALDSTWIAELEEQVQRSTKALRFLAQAFVKVAAGGV